MALPKLSNYPTYDLVIPSTKQTIKYRPFLVGEQKVMLMAMETKDDEQILAAVTNAILSCITSPFSDLHNLTTFDVEYIFMQIRAKSVGERTNVTLLCGECGAPNTLQVELDKITIDVPAKPNVMIKLTPEYTIKLRYPKYKFMLAGELIHGATTATDAFYDQVVACLDSIITDDEVIKIDDHPKAEIDAFLQSLTTGQFKQILEFVQNIPKIKHPADFKCTSCAHDNKYTLQGITDFF